MINKNDSFSIILHTILFNNGLTSSEKLLFCYICTLSNKEGFSFATNKYLAQKFKVTTRSINLWLKKLEDKKLIRAEYEYKDKEIVKRKLYPYLSKNHYPSRNNFQESNETDFNYNNIKYNNINNIGSNRKNFKLENQRHYTKEEYDAMYDN